MYWNFLSRMEEGTQIRESDDNVSIVVSDTEDWGGDEVVREVLHYLPTTEQDISESKPSTNIFLRSSELKSRKSPTLGPSARKLKPVPKLKTEVPSSPAMPQKMQKLCSWEVDLASRVERKGHVTDGKRLLGSSFVGRSFKVPKNVTAPSEGEPGDTSAQQCNEGSSLGVSKDSNIRINSREDGTTVVTASHNQREQEEPKRVKGNMGWGNNFVRLDLKVC